MSLCMGDKGQMRIIYRVQENQHRNFHQIRRKILIDNIYLMNKMNK